MNHHRITGALAALVVAGALVSCAADAEPGTSASDEAAGTAARSGQGQDAARPGGKARRDRKHGGSRRQGRGREGAAPAGSGGSGGSDGGAGSGGPGQQSEPAPRDAAPVWQQGCVTDGIGDTEGSGDTPGHVDLTGGCLRQQGASVVIEVSAAAAIPAAVSDPSTESAYTVALAPAGGRELYVDAQAGAEGWTATLTVDGDRRALPSPGVAGDRMTLTVPVDALGRARSLRWHAESSWLESGTLTTSYAFDAAPDSGAGSSVRR